MYFTEELNELKPLKLHLKALAQNYSVILNVPFPK